MSITKKLSIATAGAAFIALGTLGTAPATAASLDFSFTTQSGGKGTFTLDTDTAPAPEPTLRFNVDGSVFAEGIAYTSAISNFSFSSPDTSFNNRIGDFGVYPSVPFAFNPDIPSTGTLGIAGEPSGCVVSSDVFCAVDIGVEYLGNVSELPVLSDDPGSYSLFDIIVYDGSESTSNVITAELITKSQVVPEPGSVMGTLAVGIGGALLLLKRKMNINRAAIKP